MMPLDIKQLACANSLMHARRKAPLCKDPAAASLACSTGWRVGSWRCWGGTWKPEKTRANCTKVGGVTATAALSAPDTVVRRPEGRRRQRKEDKYVEGSLRNKQWRNAVFCPGLKSRIKSTSLRAGGGGRGKGEGGGGRGRGRAIIFIGLLIGGGRYRGASPSPLPPPPTPHPPPYRGGSPDKEANRYDIIYYHNPPPSPSPLSLN